MATATIGGRRYTIAPFRLRELRRAAPFIDRISAAARAGAGGPVQNLGEVAYDMLCVLAVGIEGASPEALEAEASLEELAGLRTAFDQILEEAGLKRGDAAGGEAPAGAGEGSPGGSTA